MMKFLSIKKNIHNHRLSIRLAFVFTEKVDNNINNQIFDVLYINLRTNLINTSIDEIISK